jgi:DNA-binding GntR family transcriptional regulator
LRRIWRNFLSLTDRVNRSVYQRLRRAVLSEKPPAHAAQSEIAAALQVSRTPVREAITADRRLAGA